MLNGPVKIDPEFKAVCPPLTKEERGELRESIKRDGCREDILTWHGFVIDGHNRLELCEELHKPYTTRPIVELKSRGEVIEWILRNQLGRRNLTTMQRAELALKLKEVVAAEAKKRQVSQLKKGSEKPVRENSHERERTDEKLAEMAGVSSNTIRRVEKIVAEAEPEVLDAARRGEMSINAAYKTVAPTPKPQEPAKEPQDGFAIAADNDAPEVEERGTEPPSAVSVEAAPEPVKHIKNWQRFANWDEATDAFNRECGGVVIRCNWNGIGDWMYMDHIEGESRLAFLKRCRNLTAEGRKEIKRLEKAEKKGATK